MSIKRTSIVLGIVCAILVFAIFTQIRTVNDSKTIVSQGFAEEDNLRDEVLTLQDEYDRLYEEFQKEEKELENIRKEVTKNDTQAEALENELNEMNKLLGLTELTGEGVKITLDDSKTASIETIGVFDDISLYLVHYIDILNVINELRRAGAQAISVNDQRVVGNTAIYCIGNVVSINGEKVGTPIVINAIGNPEQLYGELTKSEGYLQILANDGVITSINKAINITIPKYEGTYNSEYIKSK